MNIVDLQSLVILDEGRSACRSHVNAFVICSSGINMFVLNAYIIHKIGRESIFHFSCLLINT